MSGLKMLQLPVWFNSATYEHSDHLTVLFSDEAIEEWSLGLCLLREGLVAIIQLENTDATFRLKLRVAADASRAIVSLRPSEVDVRVSHMELTRWLHYFLKAYRDGEAEVDHIDIDGIVSAGVKPCDLTLKVKTARSPLAPDELRRRIGL